MGLFLAIAGVIGKTEAEVAEGMASYARHQQFSFTPEASPVDEDARCVLRQGHSGVSVFYPNHFMEWDDCSAFLSKELKVPVFSFHIHDGDFWMYVLFVDGEIVDQFNPMPGYWAEVDEEEADSWRGNASIVAQYVPGVQPQDIELYLVEWSIEEEDMDDLVKAYPEDTYYQEDWQLVDFMTKIGLSYPLDTDDKGWQPKGTVYQFQTKTPPSRPSTNRSAGPASPTPSTPVQAPGGKKPWWKFW